MSLVAMILNIVAAYAQRVVGFVLTSVANWLYLPQKKKPITNISILYPNVHPTIFLVVFRMQLLHYTSKSSVN